LAVVVCDLAEEAGDALAAELGERAAYVRTDVTDSDSVAAAIDRAGQLAPLRYVVTAHGGPGVAQRIVSRNGSPADFDAYRGTIDVYLNGTFNLLRLTAAAIAASDPGADGERGAVVLTSSIAAYEGQIGQSAYAAAKAGVVGLTLAAARDLSSAGIRVNAIAPGTMKTPIMESVGAEALAKFASSVPFPKRLGSPERVRRRRGVPAGEPVRQRRDPALGWRPAVRSPIEPAARAAMVVQAAWAKRIARITHVSQPGAGPFPRVWS
jgi:NAD(P)-dependent dehydrogenase (short-subunit alcohol dehydrogenase family)